VRAQDTTNSTQYQDEICTYLSMYKRSYVRAQTKTVH